MVKEAEIFEGGSLVAVGGDQKVVLEAGDILKVTSDTASSVDTLISYMETT
jgi:predicted 2-oxoglutarate/Fe(II)-dependent dioxygenase YbiX